MTSYQDAQSRYVHEDTVTIQASTTQTATGNGSAVLLGSRRSLSVLLDVTAASGTSPTLTVTVQTSSDGTEWRNLASFGQKTAVSSERVSAGGADRYVRATWTIGGTTPSFTFSVTARAV